MPPRDAAHAGTTRSDDAPGVIRLEGSIGPADVEAVCTRAVASLAGGSSGFVVCDVAGVDEPGLPTVDVLARLALVIRRSSWAVRLEGPSPGLVGLIALCGLVEALGAANARGPSASGTTAGGTEPGARAPGPSGVEPGG